LHGTHANTSLPLHFEHTFELATLAADVAVKGLFGAGQKSEDGGLKVKRSREESAPDNPVIRDRCTACSVAVGLRRERNDEDR